jgi:hypothetical protein
MVCIFRNPADVEWGVDIDQADIRRIWYWYYAMDMDYPTFVFGLSKVLKKWYSDKISPNANSKITYLVRRPNNVCYYHVTYFVVWTSVHVCYSLLSYILCSYFSHKRNTFLILCVYFLNYLLLIWVRQKSVSYPHSDIIRIRPLPAPI